MQSQIETFIRAQFPSARAGGIGAKTALFSSGMIDSFGVLELMTFLEETFAVVIDPARHDLAEFDTIEKICRLVVHLQSESAGR